MSSRLKVLHLPETALPWITGGKEVFVESLIASLEPHGVENVIAIHQNPELSAEVGQHVHRGTPTHVLPLLPGFGSRYSTLSRRFDELPGFQDLLESFKPDIVHFHDRGGGASTSHLELAHKLGFKTILTYHTPGQTCPQGEFLRDGHIPCDGLVTPTRCTVCRFKASHAPALLAEVLGRLDLPGLSPYHPNRLLRLLTARRTSEWFKDSLNATIHDLDAVIVLAEWCRNVWLLNECPPEKIHLMRTAGEHPTRLFEPKPWLPGEPLRLACTGRFVRLKGFHILVQAIKNLPLDAPIQVQFIGPYSDSAYGQQILKEIQNDPRFLEPTFVKHDEILSKLSTFHLSVIPSVALETGPLSAFDAFAAGLPILGSKLGGVAELVQDGKNGFLFPHGDDQALTGLIQSILENPRLLRSLQDQLPKQLRSMKDHAAEVFDLYQKLASS